MYELESAGVFKVRLGQAKVEFPGDAENVLHRLAVGRSLAGYWGRLRARYTITPR